MSMPPARSRPGACAGPCAPDCAAHRHCTIIPRATYRLQLQQGFGFDDVTQLAPYLQRLGVSHAYLSPYFKARAGSTHGYDIFDHASSIRSSATMPRSPACARRSRSTRSARYSTSCPITWAWVVRQSAVARRARMGRGRRARRLVRYRLGSGAALPAQQDPGAGARRPVRHRTGARHAAPAVRCQRGQLRGLGLRHAQTADLPPHYGGILGDGQLQLEQLADAFAWLPNWRGQMPQRAAEFKAQLATLAAERADVREALRFALSRFEGRPGTAPAGANSMS